MTKTINWKKRSIERFRKENIKDDEDSRSSEDISNNERDESVNECTPNNNEPKEVSRNGTEGNAFYSPQHHLPAEFQYFPLDQSHFVKTPNRIHHSNEYITSSNDNGNLLLLVNSSAKDYYPPQKQEVGLEQCWSKLHNLKDIEISTVSSSDIPQEHDSHIASEPYRDQFSLISLPSSRNPVQSNISSSAIYNSKSITQDIQVDHGKYDSNLISKSNALPIIKDSLKPASSRHNPIEKKKRANKLNRAPRKRKPLMDENCRALLEKSDVTEEHVMDCLYGENIDKFRELVTLVAVQNDKSEEDVKVILSNNRRRVKNRGSARRSRVSKNDHLQNLRDEQDRLKRKLNRILHLCRVNQKMKDTISKLRTLKEEREIKAKNLSYNSYEKHMTRNTTSYGKTLLSWK